MKYPRIDICDFHAHILPGADHGSNSLDISIRQLELAQECGVTRIVATPHFYAHKEDVKSFLCRRDLAYDLLLPHIPSHMSVIKGCEVLLCDNMQNLPELSELVLGNSNVLLLELPFSDYRDSYLYTASAIIDLGYTVVLAHADRYDGAYIDEFISLGALLQLNADAVSGLLVKNKDAIRWLKGGSVCALGTDIHGQDKSAYKAFNLAIKRNFQYMRQVKQSSDGLFDKFMGCRI